MPARLSSLCKGELPARLQIPTSQHMKQGSAPPQYTTFQVA